MGFGKFEIVCNCINFFLIKGSKVWVIIKIDFCSLYIIFYRVKLFCKYLLKLDKVFEVIGFLGIGIRFRFKFLKFVFLDRYCIWVILVKIGFIFE